MGGQRGHKGQFLHSGVLSRLTTASWGQWPWWVRLGPSPRSDRCRNSPEPASLASVLSHQLRARVKRPHFTLMAMTRCARGDCRTAPVVAPGIACSQCYRGAGTAPEGPGWPGQGAPSLPFSPQRWGLALQRDTCSGPAPSSRHGLSPPGSPCLASQGFNFLPPRFQCTGCPSTRP